MEAIRRASQMIVRVHTASSAETSGAKVMVSGHFRHIRGSCYQSLLEAKTETSTSAPFPACSPRRRLRNERSVPNEPNVRHPVVAEAEQPLHWRDVHGRGSAFAAVQAGPARQVQALAPRRTRWRAGRARRHSRKAGAHAEAVPHESAVGGGGSGVGRAPLVPTHTHRACACGRPTAASAHLFGGRAFSQRHHWPRRRRWRLPVARERPCQRQQSGQLRRSAIMYRGADMSVKGDASSR